jgi:hypothetical protein
MPTQVRSQGNAIANVMSMFSQIASPYVVGSVSKRAHLNIILIVVNTSIMENFRDVSVENGNFNWK